MGASNRPDDVASRKREPPLLKELLAEPQYTTVIFAASVFFLISAILHFPFNNSPSYYSDIVTTFWFRMTGAGFHEVAVGIPYVTYMFEYPPVCGLILWAGGWASMGSEIIYTIVEFSILFLFTVLTAHYLYLFMKEMGLSYNKQLLYSIFAPSIIFYGAYNYDVVQTFFVVFALYFFIARQSTKWSALALGLAVSTKLSPALLLPLFLQELPTNKTRLIYASISGGVVAVLNVPFMIANYNMWLAGYEYLKNWGLEDSFLVWLFKPRNWETAKEVSYLLLAISVISIYVLSRSKPLLVRSFLVLGTFILFSYIATPQMNIDLLPLFALVPVIPLTLFYLFEISNAMIIVTWFGFTNAPTLPSIPQLFALIRQIYLAVIISILGFSDGSRRN
jgi:hypothetical protein